MDEEKQPLERLKKGLDAVKRAQKSEAQIGRFLHLGLTFALATLLFLALLVGGFVAIRLL